VFTAYTPYQPEIAQAPASHLRVPDHDLRTHRMEVANASMYDGSTGAAEAVMMAIRVTTQRSHPRRSVHLSIARSSPPTPNIKAAAHRG